jgi:hypothetical protein
MRWSHVSIPCLGLLLAVAGAGRGVDPAPEGNTGPKIGSRAPAFVLKDQSGKERSLDEFLQRGKVALVFYRSAGW